MGVLATSSFDSFMQLMGALLIFTLVLVMVYFTTKWLGGVQKGGMSGKNLKVVESIGLGNNKSICIIQVGTEYIVVSVGKEEVNLLTRLSREELKDFSFEENEMKGITQETFQDILDKIKGSFPKKQG